MTKTLILSAVVSAAFLASGCSTIARAAGATKTTPNEFNITTKAPLVVPPEYNLRPPQAGEYRPEEAYSSRVAREALLGDIDDAEPSEGEVVLMSQAGVARANPEIRVAIDGQNRVEKKPSGFSDRVMGWRDGGYTPLPGAAPLDPETEQRRLESVVAATGGGDVTIQRKPSGSKLPGL